MIVEILHQIGNTGTKGPLIIRVAIVTVKLNVGEIIECEKIEKSQKLLKIKVKVGDTEKQIVSGIAEHYKPEELIGMKIVVVNNLKPSKLMGVMSEGMLLAAKLDGKLTLVTVDKEIEPGAEVS